MKHALHMYHLNSFHLPQNRRGNEWAGEGSIWKTTKKCLQINKHLDFSIA